MSSNQTRKIKFGKSACPSLVQAILEFIEDRRKERITVTKKEVRRKATLLFKELYLDVQHEFRASRGWFRTMCRRNNSVQFFQME